MLAVNYFKFMKEDKNQIKSSIPFEQDKKKEKTRYVVSYVLPDGSLVEMVYNQKLLQTKFAVFKKGKVSLKDVVQLDKETWLAPLSGNNSLLKNNFILFPSGATEFKSIKFLYEEVERFIDKYVELPENFRAVAATYVLMSWIYERFSNMPYLQVVGLFGTGKTRVLEVLGHLSYKAILAGGSISTASLFRILDEYGGTFVFDEADLDTVEAREMLKILRQGFNVNFHVTRIETTAKGRMFPRAFKVFGPKIMASKEKTADIALSSRCLSQWMYPVAEIKKPIELSGAFREEALTLRNMLLMFRFKYMSKIIADESVIKEIKLPRLKQTGLAILSVAKAVGEKPFELVKKFLKDSEAELNIDQAENIEHDVLVCIISLLKNEDVQKYEKLRIGHHLAEEFNGRFYDDYSNKESKEYTDREGNVFGTKAYRVSAKKMGVYIRKMGIKVERDGDGIYIPVYREYARIVILAKRYGLTNQFTFPDDLRKIEEILTQEEVDNLSNEGPKDEWEKDDKEKDNDGN